MADKNTKMSGFRVKLAEIASDLYALSVNVESGNINTTLRKSSTEPAISLNTVSTSSVIIATSNASRNVITLQNVGTSPVLVRYGGTASLTSYSFVLSSDGDTRSGNGGTVEIGNYTGQISAITEEGSSIITSVEEEL